ncbi:MAG: hypothetical protein Q9191_000703 [Dirinaria sp. TL-2023a]
MNGSLSANKESPESNVTNAHISQALNIVHNPRSSAELRQNASKYLEDFSHEDEAPYHGYLLASNKEQPAIIRHFGLSLLGNAVRHQWEAYSSEQRDAVRGWVITLAQGVEEDDPVYLSNKVAQAWIEITKRSWAIDWMDMDELLVRLWSDSAAARSVLVLTILETLSEDILAGKDTTSGTRSNDLNRACVEIFTPAPVLIEHFPARETSINVRYGEEGWLSRITEFLDWCLREEQTTKEQRNCAIIALSTLRSTVPWIIPGALVAVHIFERVRRCLAIPTVPIQLAAIDILLTLYNRSRFPKEDFTSLVFPVYNRDTIDLLKRLYEWSTVDPADIDSEKYLLLKKISEMLFNAGVLLEERPSFVTTSCDLTDFLTLLLNVVESEKNYGRLPVVKAFYGPLLGLCSRRLIRYEALPEDSADPSIIYLNEDVDTMPERHAFLGNYARFCTQIVSTIVEQQPADALYHILGQADQMLSHVYDGEADFKSSNYSKRSIPVLKIEAQFSVIEAALKGCTRWLSRSTKSQEEIEKDVLTSSLQAWCERLLALRFEDPLIIERIIQLAVVFATGPLKHNAQLTFKVFDYVLSTRCPENSMSGAYSEAVKDLESFRLHQLQRLAMRFPDYFIHVFDEIERRISEVTQTMATDEQMRMRYSSILFIITHRATHVDPKPRERKLEQFLHSLVSQWDNDLLSNSLSSFNGFCHLIGLGNVQQYARDRAIHRIQEWSEQPLDDEGKALQTHMHNALDDLPLRATKTILSVSMERVEPGSRAYDMACALWQKNIALILPNLLRFIAQAHAFHDPANWKELPPEMHTIVRRFLTDRFWQVGISSGSRDEFYAKVGETKATLEGLASSVRATIRAVRETGYRILYYMSLLREHFYSFEELPEPLARTLFTDACALSTHQMSVLVEMIRPIIDGCPAKSRAHFLPPMLIGLFEQLDHKASAEWDRITARTQSASGDDNLSDEMRDENPPNTHATANGLPTDHDHSSHSSMRDYILSTPSVLKPVILFCTHALRPDDVAGEVREFMSTEVLKACITSVHEQYFVDLQKDLAQLIGSIILAYTPRTDTPRSVLLSLPSMTAEKVDGAIQQIYKAANNQHEQRALVLNLLEGLRGVSISEQGKVAVADPRKARSALQEKYMTTNMDMEAKEDRRSPDLEGVADMFK